MTQKDFDILKAVYDLSDEIDYNTYENRDLAEYLHRDTKDVEESVAKLYAENYLTYCMTIDDDGVDTYILTQKAQDLLGI